MLVLQETRKLLDYGFNNFTHIELIEEGFAPEGEGQLPVAAGKEHEVTISSSAPLSTTVKNGEEELYSTELIVDENLLNADGELEAPIEAGQEVGSLVLVYEGENPAEFLYSTQREEVPVVTETAVERAGWFSMTMRAIGGFFSGVWNGVADTVKGWFS